MTKHVTYEILNADIAWKMLLKSTKYYVNRSQTLLVQNSNDGRLFSLKVPDWVEHRKLAGGRKFPFLIVASTFHYPDSQACHPPERGEESCSLRWRPMWGLELYSTVWAKPGNVCQLMANEKLQRDDGWSSAPSLMSIFCKETLQQPQPLPSPDPCLIKVGQGSLITRTSCVLLVVVSLSCALSRCRSNYRLRWKSLLLPPARVWVWGEGESVRRANAQKDAVEVWILRRTSKQALPALVAVCLGFFFPLLFLLLLLPRSSRTEMQHSAWLFIFF